MERFALLPHAPVLRTPWGILQPPWREEEGTLRLRRSGIRPLRPPLSTLALEEGLVERAWESLHQSPDVVVFTSSIGVLAASAVARGRGKTLGDLLRGVPSLWCVGPGTRSTLEGEGVAGARIPLEASAKGVAGEILPSSVGKRVVVLRSRLGDPALREILEKGGARVEDLPIYGPAPLTLGPEHEELLRGVRERKVVGYAFSSGSSFRTLWSLFERGGEGSLLLEGLRGNPVVVLGPKTAEVVRGYGIEPTLSPSPSRGALAWALCEALKIP